MENVVDRNSPLFPGLWRAIAGCLLGLFMLLPASCKNRSSPSSVDEPPVKESPKGPWVKADPNPVGGDANPGSTTISWNTGDGKMGQVYLKAADFPEKLFTGGPYGSEVAPWIGKGAKYEFLLYAGTDHKTVLARVTVIKE